MSKQELTYPDLYNAGDINLGVYTTNKTGKLQNAYSPLLNLMTNEDLGDFTTSLLHFDPNNPVDIIITDEYDGSQNLIINDDVNEPRLINSRMSVLENHTFLIPEHLGNVVTNVYNEETLSKDISLLKLYDLIPSLKFNGLLDGGEFKCGSYTFYFKLSDADGNLSNIIQQSGVILVHIGEVNTSKVRMGMEDESADKLISFTLDGIDSGFDYVRVFFERSSSNNSGAVTTLYYMVDLNFPIVKNKSEILLTGLELLLAISKSDITNEFADIASAKTQTVLHNILFIGNTTAHELDYLALQELAWRIIPSLKLQSFQVGGVDSEYSLLSTNGSKRGAYYNVLNVYEYTGYWPDEYYRFGVVFIFDNNLLSSVFNIQGIDFESVDGANYEEIFIPKSNGDYIEHTNEPENFIFNSEYMTNSKGVVKFSKHDILKSTNKTLTPNTLGIQFDLTKIGHTNKDHTDDWQSVLRKHHIKGLFFVRLKRVPSIIALGIVIGLTGKDHGSLPVVKDADGKWCTYSFLNRDRLLMSEGSKVSITSLIETKALLVPDFELNTATYNLLFTSQEYALEKIGSMSQSGSHTNLLLSLNNTTENDAQLARITAVPLGSLVKTDGVNYFATLAGIPEEPYKTEDVNRVWNKTAPQYLTTSTSVVRGKWGSYVGISNGSFEYGDIVNIKIADFINNPNYNLLEFLKRFNDSSLYSAISPRYNYNDKPAYTCYGGDCFPSMFTHRMMSNFLDPELPTNRKIVDPGCWAKNYAVRCTAEILTDTHSNLTDDSGGWYVPSPKEKKSNLVSLVFGILTGNIGIIIKAAKDLASKETTPVYNSYTNEIALAFEIFVGDQNKTEESETEDTTVLPKSTYDESLYASMNNKYASALAESQTKGYIKKVNPKELEVNSGGLNLKALFKSDDNWELHGLSQINRADVNAVSFGLWITFPICSSANLAFRDVDFSQATEEAKFNKKRAFYPLEEMDITNNLNESQVINGACRKSISNIQTPAYRTTPYIKQEFFNRIYWSKPNIAENIINSYRMIFRDQYREYNKEFGAITKLESLGDNLVVIFQHGIGLLPVNRSIGSEADATPYLASRNVLPAQVSIVTPDYGSMWKDSVLKVPDAPVIFGVDTVARKIWMLSTEGIKFISDHIVTKFLNDFIDLSEYDFEEYQGHINVKTHYNAFKKDVIFTYYKDIWNEEEKVWKKGTTWSLCYNLVTQTFTTFYDWYPVESCNVDNIYFSFDKELIDNVLNKTNDTVIIDRIPELEQDINFEYISKAVVDPQFSEKQKKYYYDGTSLFTISEKPGYTTYICLYSQIPVAGHWGDVDIHANTGWTFYYTTDYQNFLLDKGEYYDVKVVYIKDGISDNINDKWPETGFNLRNSTPNRMLLWKHGQAGLYDNQGKIKPTHWYGKQHEFNFEFVVNENPVKQKIFNNLKILANKAAPAKFEYEVVGEGYEWFEFKPIVEWINKQIVPEGESENYWWLQILGKKSGDVEDMYPDFPGLFDRERTIHKLPYLKMKHTDKKGTPERPYYKWDGGQTYWSGLSSDIREDKYSYNCSEPCFIEDDQLNETRIRTEQLGNDMKKYGRIRGNMQYLEDLWDVEIRPVQITWCYKENDELKFKKLPETRHRDKYIKVKVRYSGEDLALILAIYTIFEESYA